MLNKEQGLKITQPAFSTAPIRSAALCGRGHADAGRSRSLEEGSLDHIARQMDGNGRWLDKGRAGPKVRKVEGRHRPVAGQDHQEDGRRAEQGKQPRRAPRSPTSRRKTARPCSGRRRATSTSSDIGHKSGWGNLPPKQREEALQQMGKRLPPALSRGHRAVLPQAGRRREQRRGQVAVFMHAILQLILMSALVHAACAVRRRSSTCNCVDGAKVSGSLAAWNGQAIGGRNFRPAAASWTRPRWRRSRPHAPAAKPASKPAVWVDLADGSQLGGDGIHDGAGPRQDRPGLRRDA